ncbi:hypothetical protein [Lactiplantibacillus garii]|uniref:hypothetical protein n=1 Tax=Lactiplantibacillus garii TaxID=2306423 RepID=UPI0015CFA8CB|nr:hypothetical protein [Lactiplantibacillus garii]
MVTEAVATVLLLIVFMIAFTYYLNTLFFRRIEKKEKHDQPFNFKTKNTNGKPKP